MTSTQQRVAVVTGASKGIGKAIALGLASQADVIYVNYSSNPNRADEVVKLIEQKGKKAFALGFNVSNAHEVTDAFEKITKDAGGIDILVNNAGISIDTLMLRAKESDWDQVMDINLKGAFLCSKAALKSMLRRENPGRIIFVSSVVGLMGNAGQTPYASSKAGLFGLCKSMAKEVASRNITVNAIAPGFVRTDMTDQLKEDQKQALLNQIPLKRWAEPEEISHLVEFLASDSASYITGQTISINGGLYL